MLTVGSLFSGIGGLELGLERAGMTTRWQVEYNDYAQKVLAKHWPDVPRHKDVRHVGAHNLTPVDLICGGFPCQPHSLLGARKASADERDLWAEFARIVSEIKPRWVVAENVPGLLTSLDPVRGRTYGGAFFGRVLSDLATLGYDAEWECLPAAAFGAPHQRDRVFLVAYPACLFRENQMGVFTQPPPRQLRRIRAAGYSAGIEWEADEPPMAGMAHGIPGMLDRTRVLGNAVVPQVAQWIGERILAAEADQ